jgi:Domain of unknown function (DU1801)
MYEAKTKPTASSVRAYVDAIADEQRRADCRALIAMFTRVTKCEPKMWGPGIVGFGSYHYRYASGHEGDAPLAGFSSRKAAISIYLMAGFEGSGPLLAKLGKHKAAKACLYVKRLADIDTRVLQRLASGSVAEMKRRYPAKK